MGRMKDKLIDMDYQATLKDIQELEKLMRPPEPTPALGIAGEVGEVVDLIKKSYTYGKPVDTMKVCEELGDLLHYMTRLSDKLGLGMNVIRERNISKLKKRFGDSYSDEKAIARRDKQ